MVVIRVPVIGLLFILLAVLVPPSNSETEAIKQSLVNFMKNLSGPNFPTQNSTLDWDMTTDPCLNHWHGVSCDESGTVVGILLSGFRFSGILDAESLCSVKSLIFLKLHNNSISGPVPEEIGQCDNLSILNLSNNRFVGPIPDEIGSLANLTILDMSSNRLSGSIPESLGALGILLILDLGTNQLSGSIPESITWSTNRDGGGELLRFFQAENNRLTGSIPGFDFDVLVKFNVSNNELSGPVPEQAGSRGFGADCFMGNPGLCGKPLLGSCSASPVPSPVRSASPGWKGLGLLMMIPCSIGISLVSSLF